MRTAKQFTTRTWLASLALLASLFVNSPASTVRNSRLAQRDAARQDARPVDSALSRYAVDLTELARAGRLETAKEHKAELNQIVGILSEDPQHKPVLINESSRGDELHRRSDEDPLAFEELTIDLPANQSPKDLLTIDEKEGDKIRGLCDAIYLHPEAN